MIRIASSMLAFVLVAGPAAAQTSALTVHVGGGSAGTVAVIGRDGGTCSTPAATQCVFNVGTGETVSLAANVPAGEAPGLMSGGTGPAASCGFSTCTFTM